MQTPLTEIIAELQRRASTCETAARDSAEEALTGESSGSEKHRQDASEWTIKAKIWLEAEAVVRGYA